MPTIRTLVLIGCCLLTLPCAAQTFSKTDPFKPPVYYHVGAKNSLPDTIVAGDFNGDGILDLAVGSFFDGEVRIFLGKGDGTFTKHSSFVAAGYCPIGMATGDLNGDGKADLVVVGYNGTSEGVLETFLGKGDGTFRNVGVYGLGVEPLSAAVADFNGDGKLDVAATSEGTKGNGSVMVFFGKGDGTLGKAQTYNLGFYPYSVAAGDLNGDGKPDLAVAENEAGVAILFNTGKGKLAKPVVHPVYPAALTDVLIADLNNDGNPDLVTATASGISVLLAKSAGKFHKAVYYSTKKIQQGGNPYALAIADFNNDGKVDVAFAQSEGLPGLLYGNGDGTFGKLTAIQMKPNGAESIATGDFDGQGTPDIALPLTGGGKMAIFLNSQ